MTARGERGQVAGIEALPFGLLVFVAGTLLLVNIWGVVDTKYAADAAAREAARYAVESAALDTDVTALERGAEQAAIDTFADHGKTRELDVRLLVDGDGFERCARIRVVTRTTVPAIRLPFFGGFGDSFHIRATHSEIVDPTRSGVAGRAHCIA